MPNDTPTGKQAQAEEARPSFNWKRGVDEWREALIDRPIAYVKDVREKARHLPETNFALGREFAAIGKHRDAIARYKMALWLRPSFAEIHYPMAMSLAAMKKTKEAVAAFQHAIAVGRFVDESRFMLASLSPELIAPEEMPARMPASLAQIYFDERAGSYDVAQREAGYKGHMLAAQYLGRYVKAERNDDRLLDVGCGTGLLGRTLDGSVSHVTGIDIAANMVAQAKAARRGADDETVYHVVHHTDIFDYAAGQDASAAFDYIALVRSPAYLGALEPLIGQLAKALKKGGVMVLLYEGYGDAHHYGFSRSTGRYGHGANYIQRVAKEAGLSVELQDSVVIAKETQGFVAVLKK